ncbi:MAG TPA: alpha/beta hydrolase [Pirellulales bacterium]|nr:alpha/beta hydrolase [Pirellulales bacterium]
MRRTALWGFVMATSAASLATSLAKDQPSASSPAAVPASAPDFTAGRPTPGRTIPIPRTISPAMQQWFAHPTPPLTKVVPQTADEWRALVALQVAARGQQLIDVRRLCPVKLEPQTVAGVKCYMVTPEGLPESHRDQLVLHLHGGAYVFSPGEIGAAEAVLLAHYGKTKVLSVDYRMPPDHPFPAALDDAVAVYQSIAKTHKPADLGVFGTSAGGGLAAAMLQRALAEKTPMPAVLGLGTPWADLAEVGDTLFTNEDIDQVIVHYDFVLGAAARLYAGGRDLADPGLSPVNGDFAGFPPTILIAGTRDMLLSATVRVHRKLRAAGIEADLHVFEGMPHGFYLSLPDAPESRETFTEVARFFGSHLGH